MEHRLYNFLEYKYKNKTDYFQEYLQLFLPVKFPKNFQWLDNGTKNETCSIKKFVSLKQLNGMQKPDKKCTAACFRSQTSIISLHGCICAIFD